ncbi:hypothetical protein, partial [Phycicoccus flavus]|uniref:hypothetical protein n=1 Tax=Phycicoccus flavus TaxID=2502783 RepID=UPI00197C431E
MELRMTVHVPRRRPRPVDVVVSWCGAADTAMLRDALAGHLRMPVPGLVVGGAVLADDAPLGMPPLLDGVSVAVAPGSGSAVAGGAGDHPRP